MDISIKITQNILNLLIKPCQVNYIALQMICNLDNSATCINNRMEWNHPQNYLALRLALIKIN